MLYENIFDEANSQRFFSLTFPKNAYDRYELKLLHSMLPSSTSSIIAIQ